MKIKFTDNDEEEVYDEDEAQEERKAKWYHEFPADIQCEPVADELMIKLKDEAKKCLDSDSAAYNIKSAKINSNYGWMKTVMSKGAVSDKIAAHTIMIQDDPVCNLEKIWNLIGMVKVGKKKECIVVIETLTELFLSDLLVPDRKLKLFHQRPLGKLNDLSSGNTKTRNKYLCHWYFEDQLKEAYTNFVQALNTTAHDSVDANREKAITSMTNLLIGNAEQENNLLSHIVNKLGDPSLKVASKTLYCLTQLLRKHSNMQTVVLKEVEKIMFRQNIGQKAQYYCLCFIIQFHLTHQDPQIAAKLISIYISFFNKAITDGDVDSKMMSALLIGVKRAFPYAKIELETLQKHFDTLYRVFHVAKFSVSLNALCLLHQISDVSNTLSDRYYSALYKMLIDPNFSKSTQQAILLNLVYKSLMKDTKKNRILAFIKRLLQICHYCQPNFACGILFLISHVITKDKTLFIVELKSHVSTYNSDDEDDEEKYVDIKDELDEKEVQIADVTCEEDKDFEVVVVSEEKGNKPKVAGWFHAGVSTKQKKCSKNEATVRNPLYADAEKKAYTELVTLKEHYHPTVALFANKLINGEKIIYSGDPLKDFQIIRFLDRFSFKNPKKVEDLPSHDPTFGKRKMYQPTGLKAVSVTSSNYVTQDQKEIPVDELFLHSYMQHKYKDRDIKEEEEDDIESVASDEFEEMLDKMSGFKHTENDEDMDFMDDYGTTVKNKKESKKDDDEEEEEDNDEENGDLNDDDDEEDWSDEEFSNGDMGDMDVDDDDDGSIDMFGDDDDDEDNVMSFNKKNKKKAKGGKSVFASAEEFAHLLEEEGSSKVAPGSSNQVQNSDKADVRQLDWEEKRNRWLHNKGEFKGKGGKKFNNGKKPFGKPGGNKGNGVFKKRPSTFKGKNKKQK